MNSNFYSRLIKHIQHHARSGWSNVVFSPPFWERPSLLSSAQAPWWTNSLICWRSSAWISSSLISHWIRVASFSSIYAIADATFCKFSCKNTIFRSRHFQMVIACTHCNANKKHSIQKSNWTIKDDDISSNMRRCQSHWSCRYFHRQFVNLNDDNSFIDDDNDDNSWCSCIRRIEVLISISDHSPPLIVLPDFANAFQMWCKYSANTV